MLLLVALSAINLDPENRPSLLQKKIPSSNHCLFRGKIALSFRECNDYLTRLSQTCSDDIMSHLAPSSRFGLLP